MSHSQQWPYTLITQSEGSQDRVLNPTPYEIRLVTCFRVCIPIWAVGVWKIWIELPMLKKSLLASDAVNADRKTNSYKHQAGAKQERGTCSHIPR